MIAKVFTIETDSEDRMFSSDVLLQGDPRAIAKEIAALHADEYNAEQAGQLKVYTVLTAIYNKATKEWEVR